MTVLAIDPGPVKSAYVVLTPTGRPVDFGHILNSELLTGLRDEPNRLRLGYGRVVIEKIESFGMAVGVEVFDTVFWSGRFAEAARPLPVERIGRRAVKLHLCGQSRAKDANVRQALIDRYGGSAAIGRKADPGPLYGVSGDVWAALAVGVTWLDLFDLGQTA